MTALKGAGAGEYYVSEVGSYYVAAEEPPGRWFGEGAARLGLTNVLFDDGAFVSVLAGIEPSTGVELGRPFGERSVRGYDVTFSAPKSVSLLAAVGEGQVRGEVHAAHDAAVDAVLGYVERHALTRFRVDGEVMSVDAEGIVVGVFRQHVSRELDPQLHSHAVIANRVLSPDGRWLALDARLLIRDQTVLSSLYHAGLRTELTGRLGIAWQDPEHGIAEMAGLDGEVLEEFSQRTAQVAVRREVKLHRFRETFGREPTGRERWRLEREAVTDSRRSKPQLVHAAELVARWVEQLERMGTDADRLVAAVVGSTLEPARRIDGDCWGLLADRALGELTETRSTWRHPDVVREFARAVPTDTAMTAESLVVDLESAAVGFAGEWLVELARPLPEGVAVRLSDGRPAWESPLERRYTTQFILDEEARLADWARGRWSQPGRAGWVAGEGLDLAQRAAAEAIAGDGSLVVIVGPAGAGKTTSLRPAIDALVGAGRGVFAVAPTATAAGVLARETGVAADTIDKLLVEYRRPGGPRPSYRLADDTILIVDEAAMVPTPTLAELARLADRGGWRVVLVGDPLQYLPVGRGGMFDWLVEHGPAIELDQVHRFTETWERDASLALRRGDSDALSIYDWHGRLHRGLAGEVDFDVVDHWAAIRTAGGSVVVLAANNDTVHRINELAQQHRIDHGELDPHGRCVHTAGGYRLLAGDEVATRRNDRQLRTDRGEMVRNRDHWTIQHITDNGDVTARGPSGGVQLPADYVTAHVELAYAQTGHAAQGRTVDHSLLIVDTNIDNRGVYVPLTRGRHSNHVYVALAADDPRPACDVLAEAVNRDWADIPAITYRDNLDPVPPTGRSAVAVPQPPLDPAVLRRVAGELRRIEDLAVPFWRNELQRDLGRAAQLHAGHQQAVAALETAKADRDRFGERLGELSPWNPFAPRERRHLEADNRQANGAVARQRSTCDETGQQLARAETKVAERQAWLDRHQPDHDRRPGLQAGLDRDLHARVRCAGDQPAPRWAIQTLGERSDLPAYAAVWDYAVGHTEQYRTIHTIADHDSPIGRRPTRSDSDYHAWTSTAATLGHAAHHLGRELHLDGHLRHHLGLQHDRGHGITM